MPSLIKSPLILPLSALTLSAIALFSVASSVTLEGDNISYQYDAMDNAYALQLFGTPTIVGDDVRFLPPVFRAEALGAAGAELLTANFVFSDVFSHSGTAISSLQVFEFGDYEITNDGSVNADLMLTVSSNYSVLDYLSDSDSFDASGTSSGLQTWSMNVSVDPSRDFFGQADHVAVSLQNTLMATTDEQGDAAWIQKKLVFTATASTVPVPASAWLFASALLGMAGIARRR
ncbi:VPLPA-CTERM sorting domain-containing protein [Oceanicoccus sagamiensis]|uniref:PEP-CTERM protein-sorting domain-containing protein n=1 Tax=Oceanicoccus sagamiensis TaxID=716816 RepID=A0A1X9NEY9_9GAMM|nr:VPLPA-CTERM sorting domain-containing protein [Oceanicoccus sagamiensis]ARN75614.1 hypothetical protein BST96_16780 [Oceanicoccus sagamiensis]